MEKLTFTTEDNETVEMYVVEETRVSGVNYLLVTESEDNLESECYIMKDVSQENDTEAVYEFVEDEDEIEAVGRIFEELLEDEE
ncbi:MAG: DUF1292 domain-containing protein [Lachnospira sp.]